MRRERASTSSWALFLSRDPFPHPHVVVSVSNRSAHFAELPERPKHAMRCGNAAVSPINRSAAEL